MWLRITSLEMTRGNHKRNRNEPRSKFRKLWKEREQLLSKNVPSEDGENNIDSSILKDSANITDLNQNLEVKRVHVPKTKYVISFG